VKSIASGGARIACLVALAALAGCPSEEREPYVFIGHFTSVPPSATGAITNDFEKDIHRVTMTVGVALAARCSDYCPDQSNYDCVGLRVDSDDATVIATRALYRNGRQPTEIVLVASKVGDTILRVQTACAEQRYEVHVTP
jgi:hypothetical protein